MKGVIRQNGGITKNLGKIALDTLKLLCFRQFRLDQSIYNWYLGFGLFFTWLCGIGRYWDNPRAEIWQYLGLGSVVYIFVLAFIVWILIKPLGPRNWSYKNILLFISLTSPPAILYAIPVERFTDLDSEQTQNDAAYFILILITGFSVIASPILLITYVYKIGKRG
jgi:hypothetical protein